MQKGIFTLVTITIAVVMYSCEKENPVTPQDTTPPLVISIRAYNGNPIGIDDSLLIVFSEPIDPSTCNNSTISLGNYIPINIYCLEDSITCNPIKSLDYQTTYLLTISDDITDFAGNHLSREYDHYFTSETAPVGSFWTPRFEDPNGLQDVAYSGSAYVAVGWNGSIARSENGYYWYSVESPTDERMRQIIWADTMFIAIEDGGHVMTSLDGIKWNFIDLPHGSWPLDIAYSGSNFIVIDFWGNIYTSADAINWTTSYTSTDKILNGAVWAVDKFIVLGNDQNILLSMDGLNWVETSFPDTLAYAYDFGDIAWSGEVAVGLITNYVGRVIVSNDGYNWAIRYFSHLDRINGISWTGDKFVIGGSFGWIATSPGGRNWTKRECICGDWLWGSCGTPAFKVIVGKKIYTSP
jgi:hypothetical protein